MKFKPFCTSLMLVSMAIATPAWADTKIGFVNTERLLREAPLSVAAQKKLEREFASRDQELQKLAKQARDLQAQLDTVETRWLTMTVVSGSPPSAAPRTLRSRMA